MLYFIHDKAESQNFVSMLVLKNASCGVKVVLISHDILYIYMLERVIMSHNAIELQEGRQFQFFYYIKCIIYFFILLK